MNSNLKETPAYEIDGFGMTEKTLTNLLKETLDSVKEWLQKDIQTLRDFRNAKTLPEDEECVGAVGCIKELIKNLAKDVKKTILE